MNLKLRHHTLISSTLAALGSAIALSTATPAQALTSVNLFFGCFDNSSTCANRANLFQAKVSSYGPTQVLFQFFNKSTQSSITEVYFDDPDPTSLGALTRVNVNNQGTVNFNTNFKGPNNLPGGNGIGFSADYAAGADPNGVKNGDYGVNPGESLGLLFDVKPGFANPFNAVITDLQRGSLRLGMHVQRFEDGSSEKFSTDPEGVPEPMTLLGSGAAIGLGTLMKRRAARLKKAQEC